VSGRLTGRVAVVTGASSGIGRAIACLFASEGSPVVGADRVEKPIEGGDRTVDLIRSGGGRAEFVHADLANSADVSGLVDATLDKFDRIDVLVNNAAAYVSKPLLTTSEREWDYVFAVNVKSVFLLSQLAVAQMLTQDLRNGTRGRIVNITSQHGFVAAPQDIAYGTSKAAVVYITRQIATDYARDGIVCNAVAPGKVVTGKGGREDDEEWIASWAARTPVGRLGAPEDVARAALFLASDEATFISGTNLMVDGGWSAS